MTKSSYYPDVFGYITDADRQNIGGVQVALGLKPAIVRAGRPVEVMMLMQNTLDVPVDVAVTLQPPEKDAAGKKGRFITKKSRLVIGLEPAEVGYAMIPMTTMPDTAISRDYSIGMEISTKQLDKGHPVRDESGGTPFEPSTLPKDRRQLVEELKQLTFSGKKRGFLRSSTLEVQLGVLAGKVGSLKETKPDWFSLWTLADHDDVDALVERLKQPFLDKVLPGLRKERINELLFDRTRKRFEAAGYPLSEVEARFAAKLMVYIIHLASERLKRNPLEVDQNTKAYQIISVLDPEPGIEENDPTAAALKDVELPRWFKAMLRGMARDDRVIAYPDKALPHIAYDELLYDAMQYGFHMIQTITGIDLGTQEEMHAYTETVVQTLAQKGKMNISYAYIPLIAGGIAVYDQVLLSGERLDDMLHELRVVIDARDDEKTAENELIFDVAQRVVDYSLKKYGFYDQ